MNADQRALLRHFLATLAYRTQKAIRGAPPDYWFFEAGHEVRTPKVLLEHMTSVLGHARCRFRGGEWWPDPLDTPEEEIIRFHDMLQDLSDHLEVGDALVDTTPYRLLQGPFSDAMTHAGQLAMLRRLHGVPVPPEDFIHAEIDPGEPGRDPSAPTRPDTVWPAASTS